MCRVTPPTIATNFYSPQFSYFKLISNSLGALSLNLTSSIITTTSTTVSWTQSPFSFAPVGYIVTLTRVTGSNQTLCTEIMDKRYPLTILFNVTSMEFTGLHEFSTYRVNVTAMFNAFGLSRAPFSMLVFTTLSTGRYDACCIAVSEIKLIFNMQPPLELPVM